MMPSHTSSIENAPSARRSAAWKTICISRSPSSSQWPADVAALERVEDLVGLLDQERAQRVERLLAVPRASVGRQQPVHDRDEALERLHVCYIPRILVKTVRDKLTFDDPEALQALCGTNNTRLKLDRADRRRRAAPARQRDHDRGRRGGDRRSRAPRSSSSTASPAAARRSAPTTSSARSRSCAPTPPPSSRDIFSDTVLVAARGPPDRAQGPGAEALRRRGARERHRVRDRPRRHRQDLPRDGAGGARACSTRQVKPDRPDPPGGRGRREARLPARHARGEGQPVPAPALRRAPRHARPRARRSA